MFYLLIGNIGRRLAEWAEWQLERRGHGKHLIEQMRAAEWLQPAPSVWWKS